MCDFINLEILIPVLKTCRVVLNFMNPFELGVDHGTYVRWLFRNSRVLKEQFLLFDLLKAFD